MEKQFHRILIFAVLIGVIAMLGGALIGCGQSDKEKIMALADEYDALIDKYEDTIVEKREAKDVEGYLAAVKAFQTESLELNSNFDGLLDNLSKEDEKEVRKRMKGIARRISKMLNG